MVIFLLQVYATGGDPDSVAGEFGRHSLYKMLGYFSLVGLLRLHSLLGDYYQAIKVLIHVTYINIKLELFEYSGVNILYNISILIPIFRSWKTLSFTKSHNTPMCLLAKSPLLTMWDLPTWWCVVTLTQSVRCLQRCCTFSAPNNYSLPVPTRTIRLISRLNRCIISWPSALYCIRSASTNRFSR